MGLDLWLLHIPFVGPDSTPLSSFFISFCRTYSLQIQRSRLCCKLWKIVDNWPTYILRYLFCDPPTPTILKKLIAFFYGNDVPCPMACQLYHACNDKSNACVTEYFYRLYFIRQRSLYKVHLAEYYNLCIKKCVYQWSLFEPAWTCITWSEMYDHRNRKYWISTTYKMQVGTCSSGSVLLLSTLCTLYIILRINHVFM